MKKYKCMKDIVFEYGGEVATVSNGTIWEEPFNNRPNDYVHLEQNGNPCDWIDVPIEAMGTYFREVTNE